MFLLEPSKVESYLLVFFAMYMHDLIEKLRGSGYGTYVIQMCLACIFFADDIVLLSPSRHGLQQLLNICFVYCEKFCLDFNVKKCKIMVAGYNSHNDIPPLSLGGALISSILASIYKRAKVVYLFRVLQYYVHSIVRLTLSLTAR